jgi:hypothetical protein
MAASLLQRFRTGYAFGRHGHQASHKTFIPSSVPARRGMSPSSAQGTSVSVQPREFLAHANARPVTLMLDGGEAGRAASEEVAGVIANVAWCRIVHLANGRQPDNVDRAELEQLLGRTEK